MKTLFAISLVFTIVLVANARNPRCPEYNDQSQATHIAHESDCTLFYKCDSAGELVVQQCYPGLHFSEALSTCDYPEVANCKIVGSVKLTAVNP